MFDCPPQIQTSPTSTFLISSLSPPCAIVSANGPPDSSGARSTCHLPSLGMADASFPWIVTVTLPSASVVPQTGRLHAVLQNHVVGKQRVGLDRRLGDARQSQHANRERSQQQRACHVAKGRIRSQQSGDLAGHEKISMNGKSCRQANQAQASNESRLNGRISVPWYTPPAASARGFTEENPRGGYSGTAEITA